MTGTSVKIRGGLARHGVRALFAGAALTALAGCSYWDLWAGDPAVSLQDSGKWLVLPMRAFVSRDNITVDGMQLCTRAKCGYDAAIERFTVTGPDADVWEKALTQPHQLAALIGKPYPKSPYVKNPMPAPKVAADSFTSGQWTGVQLTMSGGKKDHHLSSYAVGERNKTGTSFIVVIAGDADIAKKLITEATQ